MIELHQILGFSVVSLMIALSPGPSWVYTISTTLGHGRKAGMIGNLGNSTGILGQAAAAVCGLSALLKVSATAFMLVKFIGCGYLAWLALKAFRQGPMTQVRADGRSRSYGQIYRNGALVCLLNPKITLLMVALLPQFIDPASSYPAAQIALLGGLHALMAGLVHTHVVLLVGYLASRLKTSGRFQRWMRWATGSLFLGFSVKLAFASR